MRPEDLVQWNDDVAELILRCGTGSSELPTAYVLPSGCLCSLRRRLPAVLGRVLPPYQPQLSESELLQLQAEVADDELEFGCPSFVFASSRSNRSQLMSVSVLQVIGNTKFTISDLVPSDTVEYLKARVW